MPYNSYAQLMKEKSNPLFIEIIRDKVGHESID